MTDFDETVHLIAKLNRALLRAGEEIGRNAGQTHARRLVLQEACIPSSVASISRRLGRTRQSVQRVANLLVADGLAKFLDNPDHVRAKLMSVTELGDETLNTVQAQHEAWLAKVTPLLANADLGETNKALTRILATLNSCTLVPDQIPGARTIFNDRA